MPLREASDVGPYSHSVPVISMLFLRLSKDRSSLRATTFHAISHNYLIPYWAWGSLVVKALRYKSAVTLGIYSVAADISMCPRVDSASKNEYQDIPGGKGDRCVRVKTLPPSCAECLVFWSLNQPEPSGPHRPVIGIALPFYLNDVNDLG